MSFSTADRPTAAVLTVSDSCVLGERADASGPAVAQFLEQRGFHIVAHELVSDDASAIQQKLIAMCRLARLVVTTGGTGVAPRDVTPEATRPVCERMVDGIVEFMRAESAKKTRFAALGRGLCGIRGSSLILNLPGSPAGAVDSLEIVADLLPHALDLIAGKTDHATNEPSTPTS